MIEGPFSKIEIFSIVKGFGVSYVEIMDQWTIDDVADALCYLEIREDAESLAEQGIK